MNHRVDVAIVGAGPAGLQAARAAAEARVRVAVIDRYPRPGGQYFKQPRPGLATTIDSRRQQQARALFQRLREAENVLYWSEARAWGAFPATDEAGWLLALDGSTAPPRVHARALILATGAYDRPIAFPGWTLPGVFTTGAAQTLLKSEGVLPGRRVLVAGSGPLQWAVAASLVEAGAEVAALLEAVPLKQIRLLEAATAFWRQGERLREAWSYWRTLRKAKTDIRFGWTVVEVRRFRRASGRGRGGHWLRFSTRKSTGAAARLRGGFHPRTGGLCSSPR